MPTTVTPYLIVDGAAQAIAFYQQAFGARETMRLADPSGRIGHAQITIGDALVMLADEHPEMNIRGPKALGGSPVTLHVRVDDVDAVAARAVAAGARVVFPVKDQFYGERAGRLEDPFGHLWIVSTHTEDVSPAEMQRRYDEMTKPQGG